MPQLNPEVGIPTIQLVELGTSRKELLEIYVEVYKQHQLPGSPLGEPAILEVLATVPDCLGGEDEIPTAQAQPSCRDSHPSKSRRAHQRRESSVDSSLARVQEAHQKVLSAVMALEEEIEKLKQMRAHSQSEVRSRSWDCWRAKEERQKKRCH